MAKIKITGAAEQKKFSIEHMFEKQNGLLFDSLSIAGTFKKYYSSLAEKTCVKTTKTSE